MSRILIVDDDANLREVLAFALREAGHEVVAAADGESAAAEAPALRPELVITDLKMPGMSGLDVLQAMRRLDPPPPVIVLTAYGTIEEAVEAMKLGAFHYLTKPFNRDELRLVTEQALERRRLEHENRVLRDRLRDRRAETRLVHASESMARVIRLVQRIAPSEATVLVSGESGTGKELVAQALHELSDRWERPFVVVNCAAIPRELVEAELFGYVRGAFTGAVKDHEGKFQRADGGTLFLDEIGELPPPLQPRLLRVLETREVEAVGGRRPVAVDVRIVAATNADLEARVKVGTFREDLFHRLNVIPVRLPPLRERPEDIPALWEHFTRRFSPGREVRSSPGLLRALMERPWPGNVRELANLCQRMILLGGGGELTERELALPLAEAEPPEPAEPGGAAAAPLGAAAEWVRDLPEGGLSLVEVEREIIQRALARHGGNRTRAAAYLGIPRHVLLYRLEKYGLR